MTLTFHARTPSGADPPMEGSSLQSLSSGRVRRAVRRATLALVATGALVTGGLVAAAAPSVAATPATAHAASAGSAAAASTAPTERLCATPAKGYMSCLALTRTDVTHHLGISPDATPSGYGPTDLQSA